LHEGAIKVIAQMARVLRGILARGREVHVRLGPTLAATIYDCPGLWMDDARLGHLQDEIASVARAAIPGALSYGVLLRQRRPYENRLIVVGRNVVTGQVVGFNALPWLKVQLPARTVTVMHFGLLIIHPDHQRQGLQGMLYGLGAFNAYQRVRERPLYMSNVTEVPAVFGAVCEQVVNPYPHFRSVAPPEGYRAIAQAIFAQHRHEFGVGADARFDADRFVIEGSYTGGSDALKKTFDRAAAHRNPACNAFCQAQLDYGRGDDFLQIGIMDVTVITNWMTRRIPAEFRPKLARQMKLWTYPTTKATAQGSTT
jgi:hypothetical protein